jgi:hypothetical protein
MLARMRTIHILAALSALALAGLLAACGGATATLNQRAGSFEGGALSSFGGADGDDIDARATARDIAGGRDYDFTAAGFTLLNGAATSWQPGAGSNFGDGDGTVTLDGAQATVNLSVISNDPDVTDVALAGSFDVADAQAAIANAGSSFVIEWTLVWQQAGEARSLTAQQTLLGAEWVTL